MLLSISLQADTFIYDPENDPGASNITPSGSMIAPSGANDNEVIIKSTVPGTPISRVMGGVSVSISGNTSSSGNTVEIRDGTINGNTSDSIIGGFSHSSSGGSSSSSGNTVRISGGNISVNIIGGYSNSSGGSSGSSSSSSGNTVEIRGGTIRDGNIFGGRSYGVFSISTTTNNTVSIIDGNFIGSTVILGGNSSIDGNTLNIARKDLTFSNIESFEWINFYLPSSISNGDTMLTLTGGSANNPTSTNNPINLTYSKLGVAVQDGARLNTGDKIILIKKTGTGDLTAPNNMSNYIDDPSNVRNLFNTGRLTATNLASIYTFDLSANTNEIIATTTSTPNPAQKNLSETSISSLGMISSSADIISSEALALADSAASTGSLGSFAGGGGQSIRYNSGSHVDVKGMNLVAGISSSMDNNLYGAFIEFGKGNYDSYNSFTTGNIKGEGDTRYYGIGALGKFDLANSSFYIDSSIRVGRVKSDYIGYGFGSSIPEYKSSRTYYGAHMGIGKVIDINNNSNVDIYAKALYTIVSKESIEILTNSYEFKAMSSIRAKLGARYNYSIDEKQSLYIGAAYEREFDSKSKAKNLTTNYEITAPSIKGNSYIGELGYKIKAMQTNRGTLNLGANIQGIAGKKEGVSGGVSVEWRVK